MIRREKGTAETRKLSGVKGSGYLYVGRPSPWGNPFPVTSDDTREDVVAWYETYFHGRALDYDPKKFVEFRENFVRAARRAWKPGFGITLLCWCPSNEPCHADVLVAYLKERSKK